MGQGRRSAAVSCEFEHASQVELKPRARSCRIIDEGGRPLLLDVDVDGASPADNLPLSRKYAFDALRLLGVQGYQRSEYQEEFVSLAAPFCAAEHCSQRAADALQDLVDEAHHAGAFARVFPQSHIHGCAPHCHFFSQPDSRQAAAVSHGGRWPAAAGEENLVTWAFLRQYNRILPERLKPASRPIFSDAQ